MKKIVQPLWFIFTVMPTAFLFHFLEYEKHIAGIIPLIGCALYILCVSFLASFMKIRWVLLLNIFSALISFILAQYFITDDGGWFKPFGRDTVIWITAAVSLILQLIGRQCCKELFFQKA
ncbi:hypothetical protein [Kurthia gibsonii]|uniref:hypothetical protein n=1 Tax=Kurthia gibsonii TaxID=33946 RepID=UPI002DBC676A|nr:hypothetical protein [Kurthia gibsonii]MEB7772298.1 hypothetical protein [Kurthia gibsonii]